MRAPMPVPSPPPGSQLHPPVQRAVDSAQPTAASGRRRLHSEQLFGPAQEVEIAHGDAVYRLRRTSLGKLILTK